MELVFIIGLATLFIVNAVLTETERFGWATFSVIATGTAIKFFNILGIPSWVQTHYKYAIAYTGCYLVIGVVWSFIKWISFLLNIRSNFRSCKEKFLTNKKLPLDSSFSKELIEEFKDYLRYQYDLNVKFSNISLSCEGVLEPPQASDSKGRIVCWMAFWPFSFIGTLFNDPIRKAFNLIFDAFKASYQRLSNSIFEYEIRIRKPYKSNKDDDSHGVHTGT